MWQEHVGRDKDAIRSLTASEGCYEFLRKLSRIFLDIGNIDRRSQRIIDIRNILIEGIGRKCSPNSYAGQAVFVGATLVRGKSNNACNDANYKYADRD